MVATEMSAMSERLVETVIPTSAPCCPQAVGGNTWTVGAAAVHGTTAETLFVQATTTLDPLVHTTKGEETGQFTTEEPFSLSMLMFNDPDEPL